MFANRSEHRRYADSVFGCRRAWTTGEVDHRIRFAFRARRGQHEDVQTDLASGARGAVLKHLERAALCFALDVRRLTRLQLERTLRNQTPFAADDLRRDDKHEDDDECKTERFTHGISLSQAKLGASI